MNELMKEMQSKYNINPEDTLNVYNDCMDYMIYHRNDYTSNKEIKEMAKRFLQPIEMYIKNR